MMWTVQYQCTTVHRYTYTAVLLLVIPDYSSSVSRVSGSTVSATYCCCKHVWHCYDTLVSCIATALVTLHLCSNSAVTSKASCDQ
jgi:hypothetical protein